MRLVEDLYEHVALKVLGTTQVPYQGQIINLKAPWPRVSMAEAVKTYSGEDYYAWADDSAAREVCKKRGVFVEKNATKGDCANHPDVRKLIVPLPQRQHASVEAAPHQEANPDQQQPPAGSYA